MSDLEEVMFIKRLGEMMVLMVGYYFSMIMDESMCNVFFE